MLLIHDDDAEALQRCKNGAAGTDDDVRAAFVDFEPLIVALAVAEMAVQDGDAFFAIGKAGLEALDGLGREADLRNEHQGGLAAVEDLLNGLQVHLGFATASDAVEEQRSGCARGLQSPKDGRERCALLLGEGEGLTGHEVLGLEGVALDPCHLPRDPARCLQGFEVGSGAGKLTPELGEGRGAALVAQGLEEAGLHGRSLFEAFKRRSRAGLEERDLGVSEEGFGPIANGLGKHGAQDLPDGCHVVARDPVRESQHAGGEHGARSHQPDDGFQACQMRRIGQQMKHHALDFAALQGNDEA